MTKVCILTPRLDVSFKYSGPVPAERSAIPPIREYWRHFFQGLETAHLQAGHEVTVIERPLWQFDLEFCREKALQYDKIYIPHKQKQDFDAGPSALYYHQTVFPEFFTIDPLGWGASASFSPVSVETENAADAEHIFGEFQKRAKANISKFVQPTMSDFPHKDYILFVCQLPHDETIKYHSPVSVQAALRATLEFGKRTGKRVVVKGHPVNPASMQPLRDIQIEYRSNSTWVDNVSIHTVIQNAESVFMVNSGSGFETLLHEKPLFIFGNSEYEKAVTKVSTNVGEIAASYDLTVNRKIYANVVYNYWNICYNVYDVRLKNFSK